MKNLTKLFIAVLACAFAFASCDKPEDDFPPQFTNNGQSHDNGHSHGKTMTDLLTIDKGWILESATTTPIWTLNDGTQITDLLNGGYYYDCEKDDVIKFKADGYEYLNPGQDVCEYEPAQETYLGKWSLDEEAKTLDMQLPIFYDQAVEHVQILELTEDILKISYTFVLGADVTKGVPGTYVFILTYVPAR